jgi:hypothetical protein
MRPSFGVAKERGFTDEAIGAVQGVAMGVSAGRIRTQFREAHEALDDE